MSSKNHTENGCHGHDLDSLVIVHSGYFRESWHLLLSNKTKALSNLFEKYCMHPVP